MTRPGFTLFEMVVASALSVLLLVGLLQVGTTFKTPLTHEREPTWIQRLTDLIEMDLSHARSIEITDDGFDLVGDGLIDMTTMQPNHRAANVAYRIRTIGDRPWLVRVQTDIWELSNSNRDVQLLASDIVAITLLAFDGDEPLTDELPDLVQLELQPLQPSDAAPLPYKRTLVLR